MDDNMIIELYWQREQSAIVETDKKYGRYCRTIANNILFSHEDSEECVQDTYMRAWNAMPPSRPNVLSAFLGKITRNLAYNRYKANNAVKRGGGQMSLVLDELSDIIPDKNGVEEQIDRNALAEALNEFLAGQTPLNRGVFICRYWYFDPIEEISRRFDVSENNVYVILSRTRERLRKFLQEGGFDI